MPGHVSNVTVRGIVISLPNSDAEQFSSEHDLTSQPGKSLAVLEGLIAANKAKSIANPAVTTRSGERAVSDSGDAAILEVQPLIAKDGKTAEVRLAIVEQGHRIVSSIEMENGGTRFLGTFQNPVEETRTDFVFVRVSF
jgi:hypothetical protein